MLLLLIHNKIGNKWSEITKYLKGRTDNTIKNHWNSTMQKRLNFVEESLKNKIIEIKNRYKEYNEEKAEKIIIEEFMSIIETQMKKIIDDKQKNYENFKKIKIDFFSSSSDNSTFYTSSKNKNKEINDNNSNVLKLRKILGFRTHSKKRKKNTGNSKSKSSSLKKTKKKSENKNENIIINEFININEQKIENKFYNNINNDINNNINNKEIINPNYNYRTPYSNKLITKKSSSAKETEESSDIHKMFSGDSILSAFHCINREDNLSDKRYLLAHKYTPVKIITPFVIDKNNDNDEIEENNNNDNNNLGLNSSKKNLSILFNNID